MKLEMKGRRCRRASTYVSSRKYLSTGEGSLHPVRTVQTAVGGGSVQCSKAQYWDDLELNLDLEIQANKQA